MAREHRGAELRRGLSSAFRRLGGGDVGPIGFELGTEQLHLLQLERRGDTIALRARASRPAPDGTEDPAALRAIVRDALRSERFRGRQVVTVLPQSGTKLMVLNYQLAEDSNEAETVLRLVQERIDGPIEDCVVDYQPIRLNAERGGLAAALVAVAPQAEVIDYLELLRGAGLEVAALEIVPVAIQRLMGWLARDDLTSHSLVLHCGRQRSHLIGLAGRRLVLYRDVELGEASLVESLAKALDLGADEARAVLERYGVWPDEAGAQAHQDAARALEIAETVREILKPAAAAWADEVERAGVYTASQWRGARLDRVCLLGAFTRWPGIDRLIESLVAIPTQVLDPGTGLSEAEGSPTDAALAMGLALRGLLGDE